jgi:hypothetical protein
MKRFLIAAAVLAVAACGRPGDDDEFEETVYDANNPPAVTDSATMNRGSSTARQDSLNMRFDSIRTDSVRRDSLRRDSLDRRGTTRRDTMPR